MKAVQYDLFNQPIVPDFNGATYESVFDRDRLTGQLLRMFELMKDGEFRTLSEIKNITGIGEASVSAQLRNLKKDRFGAHTIEKRIRGERERGLYEYKLIINKLA